MLVMFFLYKIILRIYDNQTNPQKKKTKNNQIMYKISQQVFFIVFSMIFYSKCKRFFLFYFIALNNFEGLIEMLSAQNVLIIVDSMR